METVSVIIPVYKTKEYLRQCVDSVIKQTYEKLEIILVDDGSPDSSGTICDAYAQKDDRIQVIHKDNGGLSSARNAGIAVAQGKYICFVDSDDYLHAEYVSRLVCAMEEGSAQMAACVFCETTDRNVYQEQLPKSDLQIITDKKFHGALTEESYCGYACNKLFLKAVIQEKHLLFDETIYNGEDLPFVVEYLTHCEKVAFIKDPLYYYYIRDNSITTYIHYSPRYATILYARERVLQMLAEAGQWECVEIERLAYLNLLIKMYYLCQSDKDNEKQLKADYRKKIRANLGKTIGFSGIRVSQKVKVLAMWYGRIVLGSIYRKKKAV